MPAAGKSTVGVIAAKLLGLDFVDTDLLIQTKHKKSLQALIDEEGLEAFRRAEEDVLLSLHLTHCLISTGGSAVYSEAAMAHLRRGGRTLFLDVPLKLLAQRITDMEHRGLVIDPGRGIDDLFRERRPLYLKHADWVLDAAAGSAEEIAREAARLWKQQT